MEKVTRSSNVLYLVGSYFIDMVCQNNLERRDLKKVDVGEGGLLRFTKRTT